MLAPAILRPLGDRALALLWAGLATSAIGDQMFIVALSWVAVGVLGTQAGYLTALQPAAILVVALVSGRLADRMEPRVLMIAADLGRASVLAAVAAIWLWRGLPPAWTLIGAVLAVATGQALFRPALQTTIPGLVDDPARLPAANALLDTTDRIARLLGPGVVGLLAAFLPTAHFVTVDVVTFLASAAAVAGILRLRPGTPHPPPERLSVWRSLSRGFTAMRAHPILGFFLLVNTGPVAGIWFAVLFLAVPLLLGPTTEGLTGFGLVISAYGSTNLLATLMFGGLALPRRPGWLVFGSDLVLGAGMVGIGLAALFLPPEWVVPGMCAAAAFAAVGGPMSDIPTAVLRQTRLTRADQAGAMRAWLVAMNAGTLVALLGAPSVFATLGVGQSVVAGGAVMMALGVAGVARHAATEG